ncbi:PhoX family protein [Pigmentiphaga litoralis]|uniref:PhoX family protein n=1 Tax=Pigmentiphaga litoralis TaxID=516702 RepID=UPI003B4321F3
MSYLTDEFRAKKRAEQGVVTVEGQMLEDIVAANPGRRTMLKSGFGLSMLSVFGVTSLAACGGSDDNDNGTSTPTNPALNYGVTFTPIAKVTDRANPLFDAVIVPNGYVAEVLFSAGDPVVAGSTGYKGAFQTSAETERQAGGQHDGMHFYAIPNVDPQKGGLLAINHEALDSAILFEGSYNAATATAEQKKIALSNVGVSVIEVQRADTGKWSVKQNSTYNKRYTGNTVYQVGGPAKSVVGNTVVGTLNNCASGPTPWGTYLTCEETTDNYLDPTQPEVGYGWVVEIDPLGTLAPATKRTAMGRFDHENTAYMTNAANRVAFYMGDDSTPGCIYKFIPSKAFDPANRAANANLLDEGTLYVARFNGDGSGNWVELTQGKNGLVVGATDPGNFTQVAPGTVAPSTIVNFNTQADVLLNTKSAARVAGGTLMDRPEWITVGQEGTVLCTLTNNGSRRRTSESNPRATNPHGHIIRWKETGASPLATTFTWDLLLLAGDPSIAADNQKGNIKGDTFSSPDGIRIDPQNRLWVQTDAGTGASTTDIFGNNSQYYVDQQTGQSKRFLAGPLGCEITGIAYTPDLTTMFINIQHPTGKWPAANLPARSSTVVVRRTDGKPVGA